MHVYTQRLTIALNTEQFAGALAAYDACQRFTLMCPDGLVNWQLKLRIRRANRPMKRTIILTPVEYNLDEGWMILQVSNADTGKYSHLFDLPKESRTGGQRTPAFLRIRLEDTRADGTDMFATGVMVLKSGYTAKTWRDSGYAPRRYFLGIDHC